MDRAYYVRKLSQHGYLILLYALDYFESAEEYEECGIILQVLKQQQQELKLTFPTKYSRKAVEDYKKFWIKNGYEAHNLEKNYKRLLEEIKKDFGN